MSQPQQLTVVKVGGSLLSLDDLGDRISNWIQQHHKKRLVFLVGGGQLVEQLRQQAKKEKFDEEFCHWSAIRIMSKTAKWFHSLFPDMEVVAAAEEIPPEQNVIFDCHAFMQNESALPKTWNTTSDSIAAKLAAEVQADELCLLKSTFPKSRSIEKWAEAGIVDSNFPKFAKPLCRVSLFDLRSDRLLWTVGC